MLTKEYQHTCKLTGLMLWESTQLMCGLLAENPSIVAGKRVLELGCGSAGICLMVAASFAQFVVATDGDAESLDLLDRMVFCLVLLMIFTRYLHFQMNLY
jgi:methyltransferase-like protein 6